MRLIKLALFSTLALAAACRGGGDDSGDDTPMPDAPPGGSVKVKDVQNDAMMPGTAVELRGVVVTAIDVYGDRKGDFFVQDVEGGAFSGVKVFGAPLDQVAGIAVGDLVDITNAQKDEFALTSDTTGRKVTEIKGAGDGMMTVTKKGTGTLPAPAMVDAKAIAAMDKATREAEWEKWEGVLVKVVNARQIAAARDFGTSIDQKEFRISGVARVQSILTELPTSIGFGVCYESIVGVGDYFFNDLVLPRTAADITIGGTGCIAMPTSVLMAQTTAGAEVANLSNVIVTAIDDVGGAKGFWVADAALGAANAGVLVFVGGNNTTPGVIPAAVVLGAKVNVQGAMTEFDLGAGGNPPTGNTLTEIQDIIVTAGTGAAETPMPLDTTAELVGDITTGEPYEGVLVRLTNVKVTATAGQGKLKLTDNAGKSVIMDDDAFAWGTTPNTPPAIGACFGTLTGVMSVQVNDDVRTINPRNNTTDMATGAGCTAVVP